MVTKTIKITVIGAITFFLMAISIVFIQAMHQPDTNAKHQRFLMQ
jgi:hypothetical protein